MLCPHCWADLACRHCGEYLTTEDIENVHGTTLHGTSTGPAVGSSGREPWAALPRTRAREEYLASVDRSDGTPGFIADVANAERLVAACEADRDQAQAELFAARTETPEQPQHRALPPDEEAAWRRCQHAEMIAAGAQSALDAARRRLAGALERFEQATAPLPRWLGDGPGLADIEESRTY